LDPAALSMKGGKQVRGDPRTPGFVAPAHIGVNNAARKGCLSP